jgi:hypothetical protein
MLTSAFLFMLMSIPAITLLAFSLVLGMFEKNSL